MDQFWNITFQLLEGFKENCILFGVTLLAALPLGLLISMGSISKFLPLKALCRTVVWIIRGTPLLLQLFVVYYIPPLISGGSFKFSDGLTAAIIRRYPQGAVRGRLCAWHEEKPDLF